MDAVLFLKTISRMCSSYDLQCNDCPIGIVGIESKKEYLDCYSFIKFHTEEVVEIVEKWMEEHPAKTRKSTLLGMFPKTPINEDGVPSICPLDVGAKIKCLNKCGKCYKDFWTEEIE